MQWVKETNDGWTRAWEICWGWFEINEKKWQVVRRGLLRRQNRERR